MAMANASSQVPNESMNVFKFPEYQDGGIECHKLGTAQVPTNYSTFPFNARMDYFFWRGNPGN